MSSAARLQTMAPMEGFAMPSGIYQITNQVNGNRYIGSTVNIQQRWRRHLSVLRLGRHSNRHLQRAFGKYGEAAFALTILEYIDPENLIPREQHYLNTLKPEYNISPTAGSPSGYHHSLETRKKISVASRRQRGPFLGKRHSIETKHKMSKSASGERNPNYGRHHSEESRRKISESLKAFYRRLRMAQKETQDDAG